MYIDTKERNTEKLVSTAKEFWKAFSIGTQVTPKLTCGGSIPCLTLDLRACGAGEFSGRQRLVRVPITCKTGANPKGPHAWHRGLGYAGTPGPCGLRRMPWCSWWNPALFTVQTHLEWGRGEVIGFEKEMENSIFLKISLKYEMQ